MTAKTKKDAGKKAAGQAAHPKPVLALRWNGRVSITVTLATAIGLLVLVSVGTVLGVGVWLAQKNTIALLSANAEQSVTAQHRDAVPVPLTSEMVQTVVAPEASVVSGPGPVAGVDQKVHPLVMKNQEEMHGHTGTDELQRWKDRPVEEHR